MSSPSIGEGPGTVTGGTSGKRPETALARCPAGEAVIYGLSSRVGGPISYVGKSIHPASRVSHHLHLAHRGGGGPVGAWLRSLEGERPTTVVIDRVAEGDWPQAERAAIARLRGAGHPLVNVTSGGNGAGRGNAATVGVSWLRDHSSIKRVRDCGKRTPGFIIRCSQRFVCPACAGAEEHPGWAVATGGDLDACIDAAASARRWIAQSRGIRRLDATCSLTVRPWLMGDVWAVTLATEWAGADAKEADRRARDRFEVGAGPLASPFDLLAAASNGCDQAAARWHSYESSIHGRRMSANRPAPASGRSGAADAVGQSGPAPIPNSPPSPVFEGQEATDVK